MIRSSIAVVAVLAVFLSSSSANRRPLIVAADLPPSKDNLQSVGPSVGTSVDTAESRQPTAASSVSRALPSNDSVQVDVPKAQIASDKTQSRDTADAHTNTANTNTALVETADEKTLAFVRQHQPELSNLLEYLKSKRSQDYRDALVEIQRVRERLENLRKRDVELYEVELALWQTAAQLRLWAASLSVSTKKLNDTDKAKLKALLTRDNDLSLQRLLIEKTRAESRLDLLNQQIAKRSDQGESVVSKGIKTWEMRIERPNSKVKNNKAIGADAKQKAETKKSDQE